jgi:hypothetical protein
MAGTRRFAYDCAIRYGFGCLRDRRLRQLRSRPPGTPMLNELLQRRPYNAAADFIDVNVARGLGGKIAFCDADRSLTYSALQSDSFAFAAALRALGLRPE